MPEKPETVPDQRYVTSVRDQVLVDLLQRLTAELEHPLSADVLLYKDGQRVADAGSITSGNVRPQYGEVRLRFRATGAPTRYLFFADSIFDVDARTPAFSGFFVRGDVQDINGSPLANFSSWVVKREDREWAKWL